VSRSTAAKVEVACSRAAAAKAVRVAVNMVGGRAVIYCRGGIYGSTGEAGRLIAGL